MARGGGFTTDFTGHAEAEAEAEAKKAAYIARLRAEQATEDEEVCRPPAAAPAAQRLTLQRCRPAPSWRRRLLRG